MSVLAPTTRSAFSISGEPQEDFAGCHACGWEVENIGVITQPKTEVMCIHMPAKGTKAYPFLTVEAVDGVKTKRKRLHIPGGRICEDGSVEDEFHQRVRVHRAHNRFRRTSR